ncbi:MAG: hypothetical protein Q4G45_04695 [Actinomycetia bacterium]|nr:hypothetical protein [Actinomycetes bacterium]
MAERAKVDDLMSVRIATGDPGASLLEGLYDVSTLTSGPADLGLTDPPRVLDLLSEARLASFRERAPDPEMTLLMYRWNIEMSAELCKSLHLVEVVLRNAIDRALTSWSAAGAEWVLTPDAPIQAAIGPDLEKAVQRARQVWRLRKRPGAPTRDAVLAQTTFGAWRFLVPASTHRRGKRVRRLWRASVSSAFRLPAGDPGVDLRRHIDHLVWVRNRIAHLEPVLSRKANWRTLYSIRYVLNAVSPEVGVWHEKHQRISYMIRKWPLR